MRKNKPIPSNVYASSSKRRFEEEAKTDHFTYYQTESFKPLQLSSWKDILYKFKKLLKRKRVEESDNNRYI
ncbi:MAG: hypothetical protein WA667_05795 [Candidatus Nitrosopolaris sp.]